MGLPSVSITFREKGIAAIKSGLRGIIACVIVDESAKTDVLTAETLYNVDDIPEDLEERNKELLKLAFLGYQTTPAKVELIVVKDLKKLSDILKYLENVRFDYFVAPQLQAEETLEVATWIKGLRTTKDKMVKAVLCGEDADSEGVINLHNDTYTTKAGSFSGAEYCVRIAGLICGTQPTISCTYAPLPELIGLGHPMSKADTDKAIDKGELVVFYDGEKYKIARGVNSFVTTVEGKGQSFRKIKLIDLMDRIHDDVKKTAEDNYLGKYANSYNNRCLLIAAINGYLIELEDAGLLEKGKNNVEIDIKATKNYLLKNGRASKEELARMSDIDAKRENVHDNVFLKANVSMLDAIENIILPISI